MVVFPLSSVCLGMNRGRGRLDGTPGLKTSLDRLNGQDSWTESFTEETGSQAQILPTCTSPFPSSIVVRRWDDPMWVGRIDTVSTPV